MARLESSSRCTFTRRLLTCVAALMIPSAAEGWAPLGLRGGVPLGPLRVPRWPLPIEGLVPLGPLRGGAQSPDVGMENWASDYERICWNESNPEILSPMFVPKGNWTEEDFESARQEPCFQV